MSSNTTTSDELPKNDTKFELDTLYGFFGVYEQSDCQVSNDPPGETFSSLKTCNITHYMCTSAGENGTVAVQVPYEYELHYNPEADLTGIVLPFLEESMLDHVAAAMGITQCRQRRRRRLRRERRRTQSEEQGRFAGVNLEPRDKVNEKYTVCTANVTVQEGDVCVPIQGGVTAFVRLTEEEQASQLELSDDDMQTVRDAVASFLQEAMESDLFIVRTSIDKLVFIGNSVPSNSVPSEAVPSEAEVSQGAGLSALEIGLIAGAGGFFLLLVVLLACCCFRCCRRRRRRKNGNRLVAREAEIVPVWEASEDDVEGGERCLAGCDSLALKPGGSDVVKPSFDDQSATTSRTSVASASMVQRDVIEYPLDEHEIEGGGSDEMDDDSIMTEEPDVLDRLALRSPSISPSRGDNSIQTQEFLGTRSLSPTTGSQITMHAGNLRSPTYGSQTTMLAGNLGSRRRSPPARQSPEFISVAYSQDSFDEEIMGIISEDPSDGNFSGEHHPDPDVLDGHGAYLSDDSDTERSDDEDNAKRHLQMS